MTECLLRGLQAVSDMVFGCTNQFDENNRDVARVSLLLARMPVSVSETTINSLSGLLEIGEQAEPRLAKLEAAPSPPLRREHSAE